MIVGEEILEILNVKGEEGEKDGDVDERVLWCMDTRAGWLAKGTMEARN